MNIQFQPNTLYYGDCLNIMADFPENSVDLICLDPPFNSDRRYNNIFKNSGLKTEAQIKAFDDVWHWDDQSSDRVQRLKNAVANPASKVIAGFEGFTPQSKMLSYTSYMAERLFLMHRILKDTGSIYLHCDPYASHYLKLILDAIFGEENYRNEIVWKRRFDTHNLSTFHMGRNHDTIFYYVKSPKVKYHIQYTDYDPEYIKSHYKHSDGKGLYRLLPCTNDTGGNKPYSFKGITRAWRFSKDTMNKMYETDLLVQLRNSGPYYYKKYLSEAKGVPVQDIWDDIPPVRGSASLGYPTQKPRALYDRIVKASSNPGDLVLDPFAGCGTTIEAALINQRDVIGIDILPFALRLINKHRIIPHGKEAFPMQGIPVDMDTATQLAKTDHFKFQDWAVSLIDGLAANPKKVGDDGVDGFGMLFHQPDNMDRKAIIVQVTGASGPQKAKYDRLHANVRNENAAMGILITLDAQNAQRNWKHTLESVKFGASEYPPIQCFSVEEYFRYDQDPNRILKLPSLANPWTGKEMQPTLFDF